MKKEFITYGFKFKDKSEIVTDLTVSNVFVNKPKRALWGSPIDAEFGWKEWATMENFISSENDYWKRQTIWELEDDKIFKIQNKDDINKLYNIAGNFTTTCFLDYRKLKQNGYAALQLIDFVLPKVITFSYVKDLDDPWLEHKVRGFTLWDCESIVVLDPESITIKN